MSNKDFFSSKFAYAVLLSLGISSLVTWNSLLSSADFILAIFPDPNVIFVAGLIYNVVNVTVAMIITKIYSKLNIVMCINFAYLGFIISLAGIPVIHIIDLDPELEYTIFKYGIIVIMGLSGSFMLSCTFGFAASLSDSLTGSVMTGQGIVGLATGALRVITKILLPDDDIDLSAYIFFLVAAVLTLFAWVLFVKFSKCPEVKAKLAVQKGESLLLAEENIETDVVVKESFVGVWICSLGVTLCFIVTLGLFPGVIDGFPIPDGLDVTADWYIVWLTMSFMIFDFIGRTFAPMMKLSYGFVQTVGLLRVLFFPLLLACRDSEAFSSVWIHFISSSIFALTNGITSTRLMMTVPTFVEHEKNKITAGTISSLCLNAGLFTGVLVALLFRT
ncbi:hypothetical protein PCE1_001868 [Barthelona sp. PCE]